MSKAQKITTLVFACLFAVIGIFAIVWYLGDSYPQFYGQATKEFAIPGLDDGYTPQGLCHEDESNLFLTCGYMKNGSASRIYVIDQINSENNKFFTLKNGDTNYCGHAGGIATDGTSVWLAGDGIVSRFEFSDVLAVENGGSVNIIDSFESRNGADFLTINEGTLWVGEFHREGKYDTDESHFIETSNKGTNKALTFAFSINATKECGLESLKPTCAISTPSLVQGMIISGFDVGLSTSYSLPNSHLYYHNLEETTTSTYEIDGTTIELYILDETNLTKTLELPSMSEEIELVDGKLYIMFESACQKYGMFTREPLKNVFSLPFAA